jgi:hypothetical protein
MKKHFRTLIDPDHRFLTITLLMSAGLLLMGSQVVGITDNIPGIVMLLAGMILLYFAFLHPWKKVEYYALLIAICSGIVFLEWLGIHLLAKTGNTKYINEAVAMIVAFVICMPGILAGMIGAIICSFRRKSS